MCGGLYNTAGWPSIPDCIYYDKTAGSWQTITNVWPLGLDHVATDYSDDWGLLAIGGKVSKGGRGEKESNRRRKREGEERRGEG